MARSRFRLATPEPLGLGSCAHITRVLHDALDRIIQIDYAQGGIVGYQQVKEM